ncbi:PREDICTED: interleukin-20-like [Gavialis gangeticus]|uniref:interleukin-20-like n=1 Tax=Gavialis gangeticus TaxID=94835 RepID=UPI00092EA41F|nr:PREDICTED: interleukin-20-like [Gavialis gangeticus]
MMKTTGCFYLLALSFVCGAITFSEGRKLHFGICELSGASLQEIKAYFDAIREAVQDQDRVTDTVLLKMILLHNVPVLESCCLLRHLVRLYVENVFRHYPATNPLLRRKTSSLSNSFLSLKTTLRQCHDQKKCTCGAEANRRLELIREEYKKMDREAAAIKALGEMDILFNWMEKAKN